MVSRLGFAWGAGAVAAAWLWGVWMHLELRELPSAGGWMLVLGLGLLAVGLAWRTQALAPAVLAAALLGFGWSVGWAGHRLQQALPPVLEGEDLLLDGVVASLPERLPHGQRFVFEVISARQAGKAVAVPHRVQLGWHTGFAGRATPHGPPPDLRAGERWRLMARLRRPHGLRNPGGFDHELFLFERDIRAVGTVRGGGPPVAERVGTTGWHAVTRWRQHVRDGIFATVPDPRAAGVLAALAIGDQSAIDRADWQVFRDTGVAHLVSISGLHVTMFAWLAGGLVGRLWARCAWACLCLPAPLAGRVAGLAMALGYAVCSGWGVPAQRTVWMLATVAGLQLTGSRWPLPLGLLVAAVAVTLADPWALLQSGFWLSFGAVAMLMASSRPPASQPATGLVSRWCHGLGAAVRTQFVASVGLAPLTLVLFQQVSLVGFAANLLAIPLFTLAITPLALLGVAWSPLWLAGAWFVQVAHEGLRWMSQGTAGVWVSAAAPLWAQAAGIAGASCLVAAVPWPVRLLALPLAVPLLLPAVLRPAEGRFEVLAVDVGQGTAVLVRTRRHLLVYDTGPQYSQEANAGDRVLLPLLRARGEGRIDRLVLSHRDTDHVGGAEALLSALPVGELLSSLEPGHRLLGRAASDRRCEAGQAWTWDGVTFQVLHPAASDHARPLKPNAKSCVLKVQGGQGRVLLAGDIERAQEAALVARGAPLASDVLLVPHHGSRTSSTAAFLDAVRPSVAIIQAGHRNRFGHPVPEVVDRLAARGASVFTTATCGAWYWAGEVAATRGRCERPDTHRYWHHDGTSPPNGPE